MEQTKQKNEVLSAFVCLLLFLRYYCLCHQSEEEEETRKSFTRTTKAPISLPFFTSQKTPRPAISSQSTTEQDASLAMDESLSSPHHQHNEEEEDPVFSPQQQQQQRSLPPQSPMASSSSSSRKRRAAERNGNDDVEGENEAHLGGGIGDVGGEGDHLVSDPDVEEDDVGGDGEHVDGSSLRPPAKKPRRKTPSSTDIDIDDVGNGLDKENGVNGSRGSGRARSSDSSSNNKKKNPGSDGNRQSLVNAALGSTAVQRNVNPPGARAEAGLISKIYCENFMCHRKLTVELCPNVNFIYGQNGSGKSAILAALQICLGAKAGRTHRARNLKDLVRKDAGDYATAKIRVTLTNRGEDAYEPETYGDLITVERSIALKGGYNGFKLLDSNGVERSRQRKDLDDMLDKLNIQVENPVALLDQEESKKFLTGKSTDKVRQKQASCCCSSYSPSKFAVDTQVPILTLFGSFLFSTSSNLLF